MLIRKYRNDFFLHEYCMHSAAKFYEGSVFKNLETLSAAVFQAHIVDVYIHYIF